MEEKEEDEGEGKREEGRDGIEEVVGPERGGGEGMRTPLIRRVDLIVVPPQQYPYALVSWTGSKVRVEL